MSSYTHVVFVDKQRKRVFSLADVSLAVFQVKELLESHDGACLLLWLLGYVRRTRRPPSGKYFGNPSKKVFLDSLLEYCLLSEDSGGYRLDPVFERVLLAFQQQQNLYFRLFQALHQPGEVEVELGVEMNEDGDYEAKVLTFAPLEELAKSLSISFDYWNEDLGTFSNPDHLPHNEVIFKLGGQANYDWLKGL